jgi:membrane protease YdiL (CAAX protease family)
MSDTVAFPRAIAAWAVSWVIGGGVLGALVLSALGGVSGEPLTPIRLAAVALVSWSTMLVAVVLVVRSEHVAPLVAIGLDAVPRVRRGDLWAVVGGILAQAAVIPVVYLPLRAVWPETFAPDRLSDTARDLVDAADGLGLILLVAVVAVGAPIVEEIVYRGLLQRSLVARVGGPSAIAIVSVLFAVIHLRWVELPGLLVAGLLFGLCLHRTGRLGSAILAHGAFNLTGLVAVLLTG